ncbi:MAG: hypothetical protein ACRDOJ_03675 [Nocardioidaceae bacterium]
MATHGRPADEVGIGDLFAISPESRSHTSAAAEMTFLLGLSAIITEAFSSLFAITVLLGVLAVVCGVVGMITTRRPGMAGGALSAVGLFGGLVAAGLVGLRYLGLDTAYADAWGPGVWDQIQQWTSLLPQPR